MIFALQGHHLSFTKLCSSHSSYAKIIRDVTFMMIHNIHFKIVSAGCFSFVS